MSYARVDDKALDGGITWLREELEKILHSLTGQPFVIFQDSNGIGLGQHWPTLLEDALKSVRFLIPILTPSYFTSPACRAEAEFFLDYELKAGRDDLVLPIYLIEVDVLEDAALRRDEPLARRLHQRHYADWRDVAFQLQSVPDIKQRLADLAGKIQAAAKRDRASIPPLVPDQGVGIRFRINEDGVIDRAPDDAPDVDDNDPEMLARRDGLVDACARFLGAFSAGGVGQNAFGHLIKHVGSYQETIAGPLSEIWYSEVWRLGSRLQNAAAAARRDVDRMEPSLEDEQQAALQDLLAEHGPFIYSTHAGRAQQAMADRYKAPQQEQEAKRQAAEAFAGIVRDDEDLFTGLVKDVVTEVNREIGEGRHPERQLVLADTTNQNLLSVIGKAAAFTGCAAAGAVIGEAVTAASLGKELANISTQTINAATRFVTGHEMVLKGLVVSSSDGLAWLNQLIGWLKRGDGSDAREIVPPPVPINPLSRPPGTVFRDIDQPWCPEMVVIPAGSFMMGSPDDEEGRKEDEGPRHLVTIKKPFALGRYPVTFEEFDHFCDENGREKPDDAGWGRDRRPVINVDWRDAEAYCDWLTRITSVAYTLPSEACWEYACRAGTTTAYHYGDRADVERMNFSGSGIRETTPVTRYQANPWGFHDMHGNVWEWCADYWHDNYEDVSADGSAWLGEEAPERVLRGGSWSLNAQYLRSAGRNAYSPDFRFNVTGFRCARVQELP